MKYLTIEQAAMLINPNYSSRSIHSSVMHHVECGNFKAYYPNIAIIDGNGIVQEIGPSKNPFFLVEELQNYKEVKKKQNQKKGTGKPIFVTGNNISRKFDCIKDAAQELSLDYNKIYNALCVGKEFNGYRFYKI